VRRCDPQDKKARKKYTSVEEATRKKSSMGGGLERGLCGLRGVLRPAFFILFENYFLE